MATMGHNETDMKTEQPPELKINEDGPVNWDEFQAWALRCDPSFRTVHGIARRSNMSEIDSLRLQVANLMRHKWFLMQERIDIAA